MDIKSWLRPPLSAGLAANAGLMLFWPEGWYRLMPGIGYTGPLNTHFVRDIGCAYLMAAGGLWWRQRHSRSALALPGAGFLLLHAGIHVWELVSTRCGVGQFLRDLPGVQMAALAALWLGWPEREARHA